MKITKSIKAALPTILGSALVLTLAGSTAFGAGTPANKFAASGSNVNEVEPGPSTVLLSEQIKMSNPADLAISVTAECALLTQVSSSANGQTDRAFGEVSIFLTLDGIVVPVSTDDYDDTVVYGANDPAEQGETGEGEVVLCNRAQEQQWNDAAQEFDEEGNPLEDEADEDDDDILRQRLDTMTANGFNWAALNVGTNYDVNNDNIIDVVLHARHRTETEDGNADASELADAFVGARTLLLEPVRASVREAVIEIGPGPS